METANNPNYLIMAHPKRPITGVVLQKQLIRAETVKEAWDIFNNQFQDFLETWDISRDEFILYAFLIYGSDLIDMTSYLSHYLKNQARELRRELLTQSVKDGLNELINEY